MFRLPAREEDRPDPFELQVGSMVIMHRATLLPHDIETFNELLEVSRDYLLYGQLLAQLNGQTPPWDPQSKNETTPAEVFLETAEWVGHTQAIPRPYLGVDHRHFRLSPRGEGEESQFAPSPQMTRTLAWIELVQHADQRWEVLHAEVSEQHRRRGIATMLYDHVQAALDTTLAPSSWLSDAAHCFWQRRGNDALPNYRQVDDFPGLWISPKALVTLSDIAEAKLAEADDINRGSSE